MDLDSLIIAVFCLVDDKLQQGLSPRSLRRRGPLPLLSDSEVLTLEVVGEYLGLDCDAAIFHYFRRHFAHFFPALASVHRTTFVRQAANLWKVKEQVWQELLEKTGADAQWALVDSFPVAVCRFARARRGAPIWRKQALAETTRSRPCSVGFVSTCGSCGRASSRASASVARLSRTWPCWQS